MMLLKTKVLVVGLMMAGGVAAPIATFYATQPPDRALPAKTDLVPDVAIPEVEAPAPAPDRVMTDLAVKPAPKPIPRAAVVPEPIPEPPGEKTCVTRQLQSVGSGAVVICDVERTESGKRGGVFGAIDKPARLAPRDTPSPSGLLR